MHLNDKNKEGKYVIDFTKAKKAMESWAALIIKVEGEGDIDFATDYNNKNGIIKSELQKDLDKINSAKIPKDIRFEQGKSVLGL